MTQSMQVPTGPEQNFFRDPAIDRLLGVVFSLAAEVQVLRDRVAVTELLLASKGVIERLEIDRFSPDAADAEALAADSAAFTAEILQPMLGRQASRSAEAGHAG